MIKRETKYIIRRILISVGVILLLSFIKTCKVHAESISDFRNYTSYWFRKGNSGSFSNLSNTFTGFNTYYNGDVIQFRFYTTLQSDINQLSSELIIIPNLYGRLTLCMEKNAVNQGYNVQNTEEVKFVNTNIPCYLAGAPDFSSAYITFATFKITNITNESQNYGGLMTYQTPYYVIGTSFKRQAVWSTIAYEISMNDFPTYSSEDATLKKLDNIISILNTIQQQTSNITSSISSSITTQTDWITEAQNNTTNAVTNNTAAVNNVNDSINNSNVDSPNDSISQMEQNLPTNSVISDLLTLPIRMFQNIVNAVNGTCSPFSLGALFGTNLVLPCINIQNYLGSALWSAIDVIFCGIFVLSMRKKFVEIFENITSLKNGGNELE